MMMDRKIDNKRVNEITASYMLHNAHDAIGNHVPTAAQVTLDQIGSHQFFIKQRVEDMDKRMQHIEVHLHEDIVKVCVHVCVCARARVFAGVHVSADPPHFRTSRGLCAQTSINKMMITLNS